MDILSLLLDRNMDLIVDEVLSSLSFSDLASCRRVSRRWRRHLDERTIPSWTHDARLRFRFFQGMMAFDDISYMNKLPDEAVGRLRAVNAAVRDNLLFVCCWCSVKDEDVLEGQLHVLVYEKANFLGRVVVVEGWNQKIRPAVFKCGPRSYLLTSDHFVSAAWVFSLEDWSVTKVIRREEEPTERVAFQHTPDGVAFVDLDIRNRELFQVSTFDGCELVCRREMSALTPEQIAGDEEETPRPSADVWPLPGLEARVSRNVVNAAAARHPARVEVSAFAGPSYVRGVLKRIVVLDLPEADRVAWRSNWVRSEHLDTPMGHFLEDKYCVAFKGKTEVVVRDLDSGGETRADIPLEHFDIERVKKPLVPEGWRHKRLGCADALCFYIYSGDDDLHLFLADLGTPRIRQLDYFKRNLRWMRDLKASHAINRDMAAFQVWRRMIHSRVLVQEFLGVGGEVKRIEDGPRIILPSEFRFAQGDDEQFYATSEAEDEASGRGEDGAWPDFYAVRLDLD